MLICKDLPKPFVAFSSDKAGFGGEIFDHPQRNQLVSEELLVEGVEIKISRPKDLQPFDTFELLGSLNIVAWSQANESTRLFTLLAINSGPFLATDTLHSIFSVVVDEYLYNGIPGEITSVPTTEINGSASHKSTIIGGVPDGRDYYFSMKILTCGKKWFSIEYSMGGFGLDEKELFFLKSEEIFDTVSLNMKE